MSEAEESSTRSLTPDDKLFQLGTLDDKEWFKSLGQDEFSCYKAFTLEPEKLKCTACLTIPGLTIHNFFVRHPILGVPICKPCKKYFFSGSWAKDDEGFYEYCCLCGQGGDLLMCSKNGCPNVFCKRCIKRISGRGGLKAVEDADEWNCFECNTDPIKTLRATYYAYLQYCKTHNPEPTRLRRPIKPPPPDEDDLIASALHNSGNLTKIWTEAVEDETRNHKKKIKNNPDLLHNPEYLVKRTRRLAKLVNSTKQNIDKMFELLLEDVSKKVPDLDVDAMWTLARDPTKILPPGQNAPGPTTSLDLPNGSASTSAEATKKADSANQSGGSSRTLEIPKQNVEENLEESDEAPDQDNSDADFELPQKRRKTNVVSDEDQENSQLDASKNTPAPKSQKEKAAKNKTDKIKAKSKSEDEGQKSDLEEARDEANKETPAKESVIDNELSGPKPNASGLEPMEVDYESGQERAPQDKPTEEKSDGKSKKILSDSDSESDSEDLGDAIEVPVTSIVAEVHSRDDIQSNNTSPPISPEKAEICEEKLSKINITKLKAKTSSQSDDSENSESDSDLENIKSVPEKVVANIDPVDSSVGSSQEKAKGKKPESGKEKLPSNGSDDSENEKMPAVDSDNSDTDSQTGKSNKKSGIENLPTIDSDSDSTAEKTNKKSDDEEKFPPTIDSDISGSDSSFVGKAKKSLLPKPDLSCPDVTSLGMAAPAKVPLTEAELANERAKYEVLKTSSSSSDLSDVEEEPDDKVSKQKKLKTKSKLDEIANKPKSGCDESDAEETEKQKKRTEKRSKNKTEKSPKEKGKSKKSPKNESGGMFLTKSVLKSSDEDDEKLESKFQKKKVRDAGRKLQQRFRDLISEIDVVNDKKLNGSKPKIVLQTLSQKVLQELESYSVVSVADFPELLKGRTKSRCRNLDPEAKFDAEIDRLCNIGALDHIIRRSGKSPVKKSFATKDKKKKEPEENSNDDDESDDSESLSDKDETESSKKLEKLLPKPIKLLNEAELAKLAVLATSSDSSDPEEPNGDSSDSDDKKAKKEKVKKEPKDDDAKTVKVEKADNDIKVEEESEVEAEAKKKKRRSEPSFLRVKLSDSDTEEEEEKARIRSEKREEKRKAQNMRDSSEDEDDISPQKSSRNRRHKVKVESSDHDSDNDNSDKNSGSEWSGDDKKAKKFDDSDSDIAPRKRKGGKRKKDSEDESSDDEPRAKKKRKRIKKAASSSENEEEENDENDSPSKGRHNIRKIIKDKDLSESTKEADKEERERRKRMEERQKLFNKTFELKDNDYLTELPLDFDPETKEIFVQVDKKLVKKMKPHQGGGIKFMWDACFETKKDVEEGKVPGGAILAHCMGLGKTLQTISLVHTVMSHFPDVIRRVLILCPVNTIKNWVEEFHKWLSESMLEDVIEVHDGSTGKEMWERIARLNHWVKHGGCMIMGYDMYRNLTATGKKYNAKQQRSLQAALVDPGPDIVICDEGHILKNTKSALNIAVNRISTKRRIILTGTPLQNNLTEYFSMVDFVKPKLLGSYNEFKNRFVNPIQNGQHSDSTERDVRVMKKRSFILCDLLKGCMQRLDYNVLVPYLQPKYEYVLCLCLTDLQKKLYSYYLENYARAGQIGDDGKLEGGKKGGLFYDVQNLSRIWNHPCILEKAKERSDIKRMFEDDDEEDDAGSLKDFVVDGSDEEESTPASTSNEDSDIEMLSDEGQSNKKNKQPLQRKILTRGDRQKVGDEVTDLVAGLDEVKKESLANNKGWWSQFLTPSDNGEKNLLMNIEHGSKMVLLMDILRECEIIGDKVLVFSQSLLSLDLIEIFLRQENERNERNQEGDHGSRYFGSWLLNKDYFRLDGSTAPEQRKQWCNFFNKKSNLRTRLFLISTKAGGLGINLVSANRVIIFDASWNPAHDVQSIFRVYRFGQDKPVYIYRFLAKGTMEEKIYDRQVTKQSLSARVVDEQQIERHFSMNELAELYQFNDEPIENRPVPNIPKDRLLAELLTRHSSVIWKYHDHDSLLENQVDENLTEEERKAAWEEFENEKKGLSSIVGNPSATNLANLNLDPMEIARLYREQYPHLTDEQITQATRAYIMQVQSAFTRKPAYDKSHYQQEMARAKMQQQQLYPGLYRQANQINPSAGSSSNGSGAANTMYEINQEYLKSQQLLKAQAMLRHQQMQQQQQQKLKQQLQSLAMARKPNVVTQQATVTIDDDEEELEEIVILDGAPQFEEYVSTQPSFSGNSSRRGRPRLDPDTDPMM